jgi:hypothetical protein
MAPTVFILLIINKIYQGFFAEKIMGIEMIKNYLVFLTILILLAVYACSDSVTDPGTGDPPGKVIMSAVYDSLAINGTIHDKLIICDYDDPTNFEILTADTFWVESPKFSPDKNTIVFGDKFREANDAGPLLIEYNIQARSFNLLEFNPVTHSGLWGYCHIWNYEGTGVFYFNVLPMALIYSTHYYDITTNTYEFVKSGNGVEGKVIPALSIAPDTLMVFSNDSITTGQSAGFYLLDGSYNYVKRINNPHLIGYNKNGHLRYASTLDLARGSGLIVYSEHHTQTNGWKISVTKLDGSYYKCFTSGNYDDFGPVWGANSKTILFYRNPLGPSEFSESRVMILDIKSGNVSEFASPEIFNGADGLHFADY